MASTIAAGVVSFDARSCRRYPSRVFDGFYHEENIGISQMFIVDFTDLFLCLLSFYYLKLDFTQMFTVVLVDE